MSFSNVCKAVAAACVLLLASAPAFAAGSVTDFKRASIPAKVDGGDSFLLKKSEAAFPAEILESNAKRQLKIRVGDRDVWVRAQDVDTQGYAVVEEGVCLNADKQVATNDKQLGSTQMGSGQSRCREEPAPVAPKSPSSKK